MKKLCMIRLGTKPNFDVSMIITLLSCTPYKSHVIGDETITVFDTKLSINSCQEELDDVCNDFVLFDISINTENMQQHIIRQNALMHARLVKQLEDVRDTLIYITPEEREQNIFQKIRSYGVESLTPDEHDFMQTRF